MDIQRSPAIARKKKIRRIVFSVAALIVAVLLRTADAIAGLGLTLADALLLVGIA